MRRARILYASLALGAALARHPAAGQPRADCPFTTPPILSGLTAAVDGSGRAILTWVSPRMGVTIARTGSDGSKASFSVSGASGYIDASISPVVGSYTYAVQAVDCSGQSAVATATVQNPPLHLVVTYTGGTFSMGGAVVCGNDCALASLNVVLSCGYPGYSPYLAGCNFSGALFSKGRPILPQTPLPIGGTACSSSAVMPVSSATVAAIGGSVLRAGSSTLWKGNLAERPTVQQLAAPAGRSWGTTDLGGTMRLAAQCPPGTLTH